MTVIDMADPEQRAQAVASGLIWASPTGAIRQALQDVADGRIPAPTYIPAEYAPLARSYGVTQGETDPESGPA